MLLGQAWGGCAASIGFQLQSCFGKRERELGFPTVSRCMACMNKQSMSLSKVLVAMCALFLIDAGIIISIVLLTKL